MTIPMPDESKRRRRVRAMLGPRRRRVRMRPGALPGTLVGVESAEKPTITVIAFNRDTVTERSGVTVDEALAMVAVGGLTWINIDGLGDPTVLSRLGEIVPSRPAITSRSVRCAGRDTPASG